MARAPQQFSKTRVERPIALVRVALAVSSLFAIWLDPTEPARYAGPTYTLHAIYVVYSVLVAVVMWRRSSAGRLPLITHITDIVASSIFQYLTLGPSSPFFVYFVFALFSATLRWGWQATVRTAVVVLVAFVVMGASMSRTLGATEFELDRFVIRVVYLAVVAVLLVYLGQHEGRLRDEIQRLARWPAMLTADAPSVASATLEHAAGVVSAGHAMAVWDANDEPWVYVATWSRAGFSSGRFAPADVEPVVPSALAASTFVCADPMTAEATSVVSAGGTRSEWRGVPIHSGLVARLGGPGLGSAPFHTDRLSGRVFFSDVAASTPEIMPLLEVVSREVGASLDQVHSYERSRELAIAEDRIRLARDLHDGVLQSLTGLRLELQAMAAEPDVDSLRSVRLLAIERALAIEQRELRAFIEDLRPSPAAANGESLAQRLEDLRKRIALEWRTPVTVRTRGLSAPMPPALLHAVPLMVHEAIINALKHGHPSRVSVDAHADEDALRLVVSDDGFGFPTPGHFDHATLVESNAGPTSLRERVTALGGQLTIDSTAAGSRVEVVLPRTLTHA
jgi:signal transduction histidine kinase